MFNMIPRKTPRDKGTLTRSTGDSLSRMPDEFHALFDRFFSTPWAGDWEMNGVDMDDNGKEVVVGMDAPGFEPKDFDIQIHNNVLTVRALKKEESKEKERSFRSERRISRSVTLPAGTDPDHVSANYKNGVLEIRMPKKPEALAKRITVKS